MINYPEVKVLFDYHFPKGVTKEELVNAYKALVIENEINTTAQTHVGNIIKACLISDIADPNVIADKAIEYFTAMPVEDFKDIEPLFSDNYAIFEKLAFFTMLLHLEETDKTFSLLKIPRDFITEAIAIKYKVLMSDVTEEMRTEVLDNPDILYSIEDSPVDNWDEYFFNICRQAARNSKCLSRRIGAVLVKDKSILSTGYNGPPRGIPRCDERWKIDTNFIEKYKSLLLDPSENLEGKCPRYSLGAKSGQMLNICVAAHAEENSILDAARRGISTMDTIMYLTCGVPCTQCLIKIINAGIKEIVVTGITFYDENAEYLLNNSDVKVRLYNFENKS